MLTARAMEQDKISGLEAGADDYLTKPFSPKELAARIKAILRRRAPQRSGDVVEIEGLRLDPVSHRVSAGAQRLYLSPAEFRLLHFLMTHPGRVYSRAQLLDLRLVLHHEDRSTHGKTKIRDRPRFRVPVLDTVIVLGAPDRCGAHRSP